jgi:hypothetical protein
MKAALMGDVEAGSLEGFPNPPTSVASHPSQGAPVRPAPTANGCALGTQFDGADD